LGAYDASVAITSLPADRMLSGTRAASSSSLARPRSSGSGSPVAGADGEEAAADEPAADEPAAEEPAADEPAGEDADEPAADEPAAEELAAGLELLEPAADGAPLDPDPGFCVEAPQAATMPATASAATTVVTRDKRDIEGLPFRRAQW
jgi:hypothetical protein